MIVDRRKVRRENREESVPRESTDSVSDEMTARQDRAIARRVKEAGFREIKRLEDFLERAIARSRRSGRGNYSAPPSDT